jgi:para-nitrobenzyl esterase
MGRRSGWAAMALWMGIALAVPAALASDSLMIKTASGKVQGKMSADGQVRDFLGIPYAAPPVGALRWHEPEPAKKWRGTKQVMNFGYRCMQPPLNRDMIFRDPGQSEDCLTLNVWTPANVDKNAKLPVMVWIFGGGFVTGGTSEGRQDGENLAHKGVIVVSMNYRLGIFGFFATHDLAAESPHHAAGNYGLMDQQAALAWVQKNIGRFGGDSKQVMIFGESAGSISVSAQMASPLSQGLFARAAGESGGALGNLAGSFRSLEESERVDEEFAQKALGKTSLADLRAVPAEDLLKAAGARMGPGRAFWPNVDGYFMPENPASIYAAGKQAHVPLLAGWNKDEVALAVLRAPEKPTVESERQLGESTFGAAAAPEFLKAYAANNDEEALRAEEDFAGDRFIAYSTWAWLEAQVKTGGAPVYRYRFDLPSPGDEFHPADAGAFHSDDIEYVFGDLNFRHGANWRPEDRQVSDLMQTYWTNFAKTGNPNGGGAPQWPQYNAADDWEVMHLDATPAARPDAHRDRYLFLAKEWDDRPLPRPAAGR